MEIRCCTITVRQYSRENPALYGRRSSDWVCPAHDMSSRAPCFFNEEADTRMFAHATEAAKMTNKKISSHTVGTDIVVLAIHVVQQLRVDELWGWQKSLAIVGMKLLLFTHRVRYNIFSPWSWKTVGKLSSCNWVFCKNELSPWKTTYRFPLHHWTIHHSTVW